MESSKIKILLHDDAICQILQWLPVISLFRFKLVCRSWRALIQSSYFIGQHLHLHHYDPSLKDENRSLIYLLLRDKNSPITFPLASTESFEEPTVCLELNCPDLHGCFPVKVLKVVSYNGIICLELLNCKREHRICLWNPATKQSRVLPQSPFPGIPILIGFGYDIKSNDYKVVKTIQGSIFDKMRYEVYSLNTGSWRRLTSGFSFHCFFGHDPRMPFDNGKCFFWGYFGSKNEGSKNEGFVCFDFTSEIFRCIPLPCADSYRRPLHMGVVNDKIACVFKMYTPQTELWVLNEYGRANESWTILYTLDTSPMIDNQSYIDIEWVSTNGNYVFFKKQRGMCRFNVVTRETKYFTLANMPCSYDKTLVEFKESLVSVGEGHNAPICINKDSGNQK